MMTLYVCCVGARRSPVRSRCLNCILPVLRKSQGRLSIGGLPCLFSLPILMSTFSIVGWCEMSLRVSQTPMSLVYVHSVFVCVWIFESHSIDGFVFHFPSLVLNPCLRRCLLRASNQSCFCIAVDSGCLGHSHLESVCHTLALHYFRSDFRSICCRNIRNCWYSLRYILHSFIWYCLYCSLPFWWVLSLSFRHSVMMCGATTDCWFLFVGCVFPWNYLYLWPMILWCMACESPDVILGDVLLVRIPVVLF